MAAPAKFLFDTDFSAPKTRERAITSAEVAQQIAEAEARGCRAGHEAGQHEATVEYGRRLSLALEEIGRSMDAIAKQFAGAEARMEVEAVDVAVAVARKLCSQLMAAEPTTRQWPWSATASVTSHRRRTSWSGSTTSSTNLLTRNIEATCAPERL